MSEDICLDCGEDLSSDASVCDVCSKDICKGCSYTCSMCGRTMCPSCKGSFDEQDDDDYYCQSCWSDMQDADEEVE